MHVVSCAASLPAGRVGLLRSRSRQAVPRRRRDAGELQLYRHVGVDVFGAPVGIARRVLPGAIRGGAVAICRDARARGCAVARRCDAGSSDVAISWRGRTRSRLSCSFARRRSVARAFCLLACAGGSPAAGRLGATGNVPRSEGDARRHAQSRLLVRRRGVSGMLGLELADAQRSSVASSRSRPISTPKTTGDLTLPPVEIERQLKHAVPAVVGKYPAELAIGYERRAQGDDLAFHGANRRADCSQMAAAEHGRAGAVRGGRTRTLVGNSPPLVVFFGSCCLSSRRGPRRRSDWCASGGSTRIASALCCSL